MIEEKSGSSTASQPRIYRSFERRITKRAVMWPGMVCDQRCVFCYCRHVRDRKWRPFEGDDGTKAQAERFRFVYGNRFIDFMGGEPTIYPSILPLVRHCREIGLLPTCITHGLHLAKPEKVAELADAGIHDCLISVHGLDDVADRIFDGGHSIAARQKQAIDNLIRAGIAFRFNVTMIDWNKEQFIDIAKLAVDSGARVINFLSFNPHFESGDTECSFQAKYSVLADHLRQAIEHCDAQGLEANVRYVPFCMLKGLEKHVLTCRQLPYDAHEWDYNSWNDHGNENPTEEWYSSVAGRQHAEKFGYRQGEVCARCALSPICDGMHAQYVGRFGWGEVVPYEGEPITDPAFFLRQASKWEYELG